MCSDRSANECGSEALSVVLPASGEAPSLSQLGRNDQAALT